MTWDHRIIKYEDGTIGIHEVYYDEDGKIILYSDARPVIGDDMDDLRVGFDYMERAFHAPILDIGDLPTTEE